MLEFFISIWHASTNNQPIMTASLSSGTFSSSVSSVNISSILTLNKWIFYSVVCSSNSLDIYFDNNLVYSATSVNDWYPPEDSLYLCVGGKNTSTHNYFVGFMNDFRLYNRKVTIDEI